MFQRVQPISFRGGGGGPPPFDPTTLPWDFYQRPDYPGQSLAWPGTASAGTSGSHSCTTADSATQGAAVDGHIPAHFSSQACRGDAKCDQYITGSAYSGAVMFKAASASADGGAGSPYLSAQIMADATNALFGVEFSVNGVSVWAYDGAWHRVPPFACAPGSWHVVQFYYDGTTLHVRLDNGAWSTVAVTAGFSGFALSGQDFVLGTAPYSAANYAGDILEAGLSKQQFSAGDFDNYYSALRAEYPSAGLP